MRMMLGRPLACPCAGRSKPSRRTRPTRRAIAAMARRRCMPTMVAQRVEAAPGGAASRSSEERSAADDVAAVDRLADDGAGAGADDRAERPRALPGDDVAEHAAGDAADD